jgi:predicted Zn-dependent protease
MHIPKMTSSAWKTIVLIFLLLLCAPCSQASSPSRTALYLGLPGLPSSQPDELEFGSSNYQRHDFAAGGYLQDVAADGFYCWPQAHLPVKVFFEDGVAVPGYKNSFKGILAECFDEWVEASGGKIGWVEVSTPQDSDVICRWTDQVREGASGAEAGRTRTYASLNTLTNHGIIHRGEMTLLTRLPERAFTEDEVRKSYLHEVGHLFGIAGHSSHRQDIMYYSITGMRSSHLSEQDKATINLLYCQYSALNHQSKRVSAFN